MWKSQQKITIHIYSVLLLLVNTEDMNLSRLDGLEIKNIILKYLSEDRQEVVDKIQALVNAGEYPDKLF